MRSRCTKLRHRAAGIFVYPLFMQGARATTTAIAKGSWAEIFRNGRGLRRTSQYRRRTNVGSLYRHRVRRGDSGGRGEPRRLGDATEPPAVGNAVTAVYMFCCISFGLAALLMFRLVHITLGKPR